MKYCEYKPNCRMHPSCTTDMNNRRRWTVSLLCLLVLSCCDDHVGMVGNVSPYAFYDLNEAYKQPHNVHSLSISRDSSTTLPEKLNSLTYLRYLEWNTGYLTTISAVIGSIPQLEYLDVQYNKVSVISPEIRKAGKLVELDLRHNRLTAIPDEICELDSLKYLGLSVNNISRLPDNIHRLSKLNTLDIRANPIDKQEIERIRKALPNLKNFYHD